MKMIKLVTFLLVLVCTIADTVPCVEVKLSSIATASDCRLTRLDETRVQWSMKVTFSQAVDFKK